MKIIQIKLLLCKNEWCERTLNELTIFHRYPIMIILTRMCCFNQWNCSTFRYLDLVDAEGPVSCLFSYLQILRTIKVFIGTYILPHPMKYSHETFMHIKTLRKFWIVKVCLTDPNFLEVDSAVFRTTAMKCAIVIKVHNAKPILELYEVP